MNDNPLSINNDDDPRGNINHDDFIAAQKNAFPIVSQQKRASDNLIPIAGFALALALGGFTFVNLQNAQKPQVQAQITPPQKQTETQTKPQEQLQTAPPPAEAKLEGSGPPPANVQPNTQSVKPLNTGFNQPNDAVKARLRAPALILDAYAEEFSRRNAEASNKPQAANEKGLSPPVGASNDELWVWRNSSSANNSASSIKDPRTTVVEGTLIQAVLETAVNSDLPGYTRAFVSQDIRSFDNSVVLIPRGSRLIGQYKSGVSAGQTRVYMIWTRIIRPDGVTINISSPGTDLSGETGMPGKVNNHFFKKFGSSFLLSAITGIASSNSDSVVISTGQSAASVAAQAGSSIQPTIRVPQGQPIKIFVSKDLDFSNVQGE